MKPIRWLIDQIWKSLPLLLAVALFGMSLLVLGRDSLHRNQGRLVYALDDGYIHMATAKNMAQYGVWGVTRYEFTSNTSSPLWTALLAAVYWAAGPSEVAPFVLNILFSVLVLVVLFRFLRELHIPSGMLFAVLVAVVYVGTLPLLVFVGMEHALEVFLDIVFIIQAGKYLSSTLEGRRNYIGIAALAGLVVAARYEGLFLVGIASLLFFWRRKYAQGVLLSLAGLLPVALYGVASVLNGGLFFPNSVILKGAAPTSSQILKNMVWLLLYRYQNSWTTVSLALPSLLVVLFQAYRKHGFWDALAPMNLMVVVVNLLQSFFIGNNYFYRYEANLVVGEILVLSASIYGLVKDRDAIRLNRWIVYGLSLPLLIFGLRPVAGLWERAVQSLEKIPRATTNIYEQQYQMGLFLQAYYQGKTVAANDIGAIDYLADIRLVDLYGLGTQEVTNMKLARAYSTAKIQELVDRRGVDIAIVYDHWYDGYGGLPRDWIKAGEWKIQDNIVCGGDVVSFYAIQPAAVADLQGDLKAFSSRLPSRVGIR